jgi:membrane dipeptidase
MRNERAGEAWLIDGHSDYLLSLADTKRGFFEESSIGHVDLPRLRRGQIGAMLSAVFVRNQDLPHHALIQTLRGTDRLRRIAAGSNGAVEVVRDYDQLVSCLDRGVFGAILHWEGAEAIDPEFVVLRLGHELGLRSLGVVWSRPTIFAEGVGDHDRGRGLTFMGKELVRHCNELGVLLDVSHLNVRGFWDVIEHSKAPVVASHSNARAVCDHPRNLDDDQIKTLAENGGLMGINFAIGFLVEGARSPTDVQLGHLVDHIDHIVDLVGIDHVALGSDFDGATMPEPLHDASRTPALIEEMRRRGYDEDAIRKFGRDNWLRVLEQVWR